MPRNVKVFDVKEWDELVEKTYRKIYSFQQQDWCKDRGVFEFNIPRDLNENDEYGEKDSIPEIVNGEDLWISFKAWLKRDINQKIIDSEFWNDFTRLWWTRNFYPSVYVLIDDLHKKWILEEWDYIINIDW